MQNNKDGARQPIGYWSKSFKGSQLCWSALVKEARAVKEAVLHFAVFIKGCRVVLRCDHKPLAAFLRQRTKNEMANRWSIDIQEFNLEFEWVSSEDNISDCLSRTVIRPDLIKRGLYKPHEQDQVKVSEFPEKSLLKRASRSLKKGGEETGPGSHHVHHAQLSAGSRIHLDSSLHTPTSNFETWLTAYPRHAKLSEKEIKRMMKDDVEILEGAKLKEKDSAIFKRRTSPFKGFRSE